MKMDLAKTELEEQNAEGQNCVRLNNPTREFSRKVSIKRDYIIKVLKKIDRCKDDLSQQVKVAAHVLVVLDEIARIQDMDGFRPVLKEKTRDGERLVVNPLYTLELKYIDMAMRALKSLGMTTDAKVRKDFEPDGLSKFLEELNKTAYDD